MAKQIGHWNGTIEVLEQGIILLYCIDLWTDLCMEAQGENFYTPFIRDPATNNCLAVAYLYPVLKRADCEVAGQSTDLNLEGCGNIVQGRVWSAALAHCELIIPVHLGNTYRV